ncbi:MAG: hypothetical protein ABFE13_19920 [Phycisphaerales bacterium]
MDDQGTDRLLEQGFSGNPPGEAFRTRVLLDSMAALTRHRRTVHAWRVVALSTAAGVIAAVSFLLGRCSLLPVRPQELTQPVVASGGETVAVPSELIVWLDAARLFGQLGMQDRMARAVERARRFLPADTIGAEGRTLHLFTSAGSVGNGEESVEPTESPGRDPSVQSVNQILAQVLGD